MLSEAIEQPEQRAMVQGSVGGPSALSVKQREFAMAYVLNGGKGREAAVAAGYPEGSAHVASSRCLVNPKVGAEIARLSRALIHTALPTLIRELVSIATDKDVAPRDRLKALNSLLERGGIATDKAGVSVQVGVQVNGQQAQALINEVWTNRTGRLSDIPSAMSDNMKQLEANAERLIGEENSDHGGGDQLLGPVDATASVPVQSSAPSPETDVSPTDPFRAFDGPAAE